MKFCVIGLGLFGQRLARELAEMNHEVLAIDNREERLTEIRDIVTRALVADATHEDVLEQFLTDDFDACAITIGTSIEDSLLTALHVKEIGIDHIHVKSNRPEHTKILRKLGISQIIMPEENAAERLAIQIGNPDIYDYLKITGNFGLVEITVPERFVGNTLKELKLRQEENIQVVGLQKPTDLRMSPVPSPNYTFEEEDRVILVGTQHRINQYADDQ